MERLECNTYKYMYMYMRMKCMLVVFFSHDGNIGRLECDIHMYMYMRMKCMLVVVIFIYLMMMTVTCTCSMLQLTIGRWAIQSNICASILRLQTLLSCLRHAHKREYMYKCNMCVSIDN